MSHLPVSHLKWNCQTALTNCTTSPEKQSTFIFVILVYGTAHNQGSSAGKGITTFSSSYVSCILNRLVHLQT